MKCSNCPFLENAGTYEYPQMVCRFFGDSVPEEFDSKDHEGCNLRFKEAEKLKSLQVGEWDYTPKYHFKQMCDKDYKPTEEDLIEEKKLQEKRKEAVDSYNAYLEELRKRRQLNKRTDEYIFIPFPKI